MSRVNSACTVVYVRITPNEREWLHAQAHALNLSINTYARQRLGLNDRRGYRYRGSKNATQEAKQEDPAREQLPILPATSEGTPGDSEPSLRVQPDQREPLPEV